MCKHSHEWTLAIRVSLLVNRTGIISQHNLKYKNDSKLMSCNSTAKYYFNSMAVLMQLYTEAPKLRRFFNNISKSFTRKKVNSLLSYIRIEC